MQSTNTTVRQYGAAIAIVSGLYSLLSVTTGSGMMGSNSGLLMAILGVVVIGHGVVLLTPYATQLGAASGPLMVGYSLLMLLNQALVGWTGSMNSGMGSGMSAGMSWDLGMVALAVLMLISGVIMSQRPDRDAEM